MTNIIGHQIVKLRNRFGYTQEDLANIIGVSKQTVSNWETGLKTPRMGAIQKMADHFNVSKSYIIEGTEESNISLIYNKLDKHKKKEVYLFAEKKLAEQNKVLSADIPNKKLFLKELTAHIDDNVTRQEMIEIATFIDNLRHRDK